MEKNCRPIRAIIVAFVVNVIVFVITSVFALIIINVNRHCDCESTESSLSSPIVVFIVVVVAVNLRCQFPRTWSQCQGCCSLVTQKGEDLCMFLSPLVWCIIIVFLSSKSHCHGRRLSGSEAVISSNQSSAFCVFVRGLRDKRARLQSAGRISRPWPNYFISSW